MSIPVPVMKRRFCHEWIDNIRFQWRSCYKNSLKQFGVNTYVKWLDQITLLSAKMSILKNGIKAVLNAILNAVLNVVLNAVASVSVRWMIVEGKQTAFDKIIKD